MNENKPKSVVDQEIDIFLLFKSLKDLINNIFISLFKIIRFFLKNWIWSLILIFSGAALGLLISNQNVNNYKHTVIVSPNFKSIEYLYNKIDQLKNFDDINKAEVEPIIDVYEFITSKEKNIDIARFLTDNVVELDKHNKKNEIEKLYKYHIITYYTSKKDTNDVVYNKFINYLNNDPYFNKRKEIEILDTDNKIIEYEKSIENINGIFSKLGKTPNETLPSQHLNIEMFSEMDKLIENKHKLLEDLNKLKVLRFEQTKVIYDVTKQLNIKNSKSYKMVVLLPITFLIGFILTAWLRKKYLNLSKKI
nr:hypothetical protein [uncultured Flavobacterium sp.]